MAIELYLNCLFQLVEAFVNTSFYQKVLRRVWLAVDCGITWAEWGQAWWVIQTLVQWRLATSRLGVQGYINESLLAIQTHSDFRRV